MNKVNWQVKKRSGELQLYAESKVARSINRAQENIDKENWDQAIKIAKKVIGELKGRFEKEKIVGSDEIGDVVERILIDQKLYDVARAFIIAREKQRQEAKIEKGLGVIDDLGLSYSSILVMRNKYLKKDENNKVLETPLGLFKRVAKAIARAEKTKKHRKIWEKKFYEVMKEMDFLPGGRTLANAGTNNNQLANCFVMPMTDSVEEIFESVKDSSILKKNGGGVGFSFSKIRPKGDEIKGTTGTAAGPVAFMKILNDASEILQQAGGRRSGNMVVLHVTHPDILEFITSKEDESILQQINFSLGVTNKFMQAVKKDKDWNLINPRNGAVVNTVAARSIFELAASMAWRNGDPGVVFLDTINKDNPTPQVGVLEAVNLCGEQPLLAYEACNLGSVNLSHHLTKTDPTSSRGRGTSLGARVDWQKLQKTVKVAVRLLDDVISVGTYPLRSVDRMVKSNRKIGIGVMGWADMLVKLNLAYNSPKALKLAGQLMQVISETAIDESRKLGREKGSFPNFKGSKWETKKRKYMRNATLTTIAPTGSISMIANASYGIEPHFALAFNKEAMGGVSLPEINGDLIEALKQAEVDLANGILDKIAVQGSLDGIDGVPEEIKKVFVTAHEIKPEDHIKMQAAWQKHTDNAVSKTINLPHDTRVEDVAQAYMLAFELKCKGLTVYRDNSRSKQVLKVGYGPVRSKTAKKEKPAKGWSVPGRKKQDSGDKCPQCNTKMLKTEGCSTCPSCAFSLCSV